MKHAESRERFKKMVADAAGGVSCAELQEKYDVSYQLAHAATIAAGIAPKPRQSTNTLAIVRKLLDKIPAKDIAKEHGLTRQRIYAIRRLAQEVGFRI